MIPLLSLLGLLSDTLSEFVSVAPTSHGLSPRHTARAAFRSPDFIGAAGLSLREDNTSMKGEDAPEAEQSGQQSRYERWTSCSTARV